MKGTNDKETHYNSHRQYARFCCILVKNSLKVTNIISFTKTITKLKTKISNSTPSWIPKKPAQMKSLIQCDLEGDQTIFAKFLERKKIMSS